MGADPLAGTDKEGQTMQWNSVDEVLDYAIEREQEAHDFYVDLANRVATMKETFSSFAKEEAGHKAKLEGIKAGKRLAPAEKQILDLKIAEYVVDVQATPTMDYQDALILAMKREKASYKLYSDLAAATTDQELKSSFLALAQEEAKHKLRFEVEYDNVIITEN